MGKKSGDELQLAEVFVQVVRSGGFGKAGKILGLDASQVSRAVAELELLLGAQLLGRTTRRQHLTDAGALYLTHAERLLDLARAGHDAVAELLGGQPRGRLRVTMPVAVGNRLLAPHLPAFQARYPGLTLDFDLSDRHVDLVAHGFDMAIRLGGLADSPLRAQRLGSVPICVAASPAYLYHHGVPDCPQDLSHHTTIGLGPSQFGAEWRFWQSEEPVSVPVQPSVWTTSPGLGAQLATAGMGVVRLPRWVVRKELDTGSLVELLPGWVCDDPRHGGLPLWVVYAQEGGQHIPLKSRVFAELVQTLTKRELQSG